MGSVLLFSMKAKAPGMVFHACDRVWVSRQIQGRKRMDEHRGERMSWKEKAQWRTCGNGAGRLLCLIFLSVFDLELAHV